MQIHEKSLKLKKQDIIYKSHFKVHIMVNLAYKNDIYLINDKKKKCMKVHFRNDAYEK